MVPLCNWQARELVFKLLSRLLDVSFLLALIISPLSGVLRDAERYFETISFILQTHQCKSGGGGGGDEGGGGLGYWLTNHKCLHQDFSVIFQGRIHFSLLSLGLGRL